MHTCVHIRRLEESSGVLLSPSALVLGGSVSLSQGFSAKLGPQVCAEPILVCYESTGSIRIIIAIIDYHVPSTV